MNYTIDRGKIISETGIPYLPRWFCDDLVSFEVDRQGISKIEYFNMSTKGSEKVFVDDMWGGMRFYIEKSGYNYGQKLKNCEIMPYGFKADWEYDNRLYKYEQRVVNNSIVISLTGDIADDTNFSAEFYDNWSLIIRKDGDNRYRSKVERVWGKWQYEDCVLQNSFSEDSKETHIAVITNGTPQYIRRDFGTPKNIIKTSGNNNVFLIVIAFDETKQKAIARAKYTIGSYDKCVKQQEKRYEQVMQKMPVLESPYKSLNNFFALAPLYHESCKIPSVPGGVHAKTEHYWIWGWDGMSSNYTYAYWGEMDFVSKMLEMYMKTADSEKGIGHWFARDMSHIQTSMIPAQGFYISLLYQYHMNGGDISPYYDFAKRIFELIASTEAKGTGLCRGYSLVPDIREIILENGSDLSAFNNSSLYCAVCAMRELAESVKDAEMIAKATLMADRMKENFKKILFDEEKGFFVSSADADTLEKRQVFMSPSIKWDNFFCYDLVKDKQKQIVEFFENNFVCECGIMYAPVWGIGYDADSNQMHCYWPSNGECYSRLINFENRKDLVDKWISWIECWTDILMCPEGIDCYDNVNIPKPDGWNAVNGTWQAYSMRAWYEAAVHSIVGIDFDDKGMNVYPYDGEEMTLKNLHFAGKTFDIYMKGSGCELEDVIVNGISVGNIKSIPMSKFENTNKIEIIRCKRLIKK